MAEAAGTLTQVRPAYAASQKPNKPKFGLAFLSGLTLHITHAFAHIDSSLNI
jgi:hypothetical protein